MAERGGGEVRRRLMKVGGVRRVHKELLPSPIGNFIIST